MQDTPTPIAEIDHGPSKLDAFLEKNQKKLIILIVLLFTAILAVVAYRGYNSVMENRAGAALSAAETEEDYRAVIEQYGDRTAAGTAALAIADLRTTDKDAIEALQYYISTYKDHPNVPKAELQLALRQINSGLTSEATTTLDSLLSREPEGYLAPMAKVLLGDIAAKDSEFEKAKTLYTEAKELNAETNAFAGIAANRIEFLNAKLPELVEAPVAPIAPDAKGQPNNLPFGPNGEIAPIQPDTPVAPESPAAPAGPETPAAPVAPAQPETPSPAQPEQNETPEQP